MTEWLIITLAAPMASFGEEAGNVRRSTTNRPTRSALLGLAAAAMGIDRSDSDGQQALAASFRTATCTLSAGSLMSDFHTFQSLPSAKGKPRTRADALYVKGLETSITRREYRMDVCYQAAYRAVSGGRYSLSELSAGFKRPAYVLYLGRKCCPLSYPLAPEIIKARSVLDAFKHRNDVPGQWTKNGLVAVEDRTDLGLPDASLRTRLRMDDPTDRGSWQFRQRLEYVYVSPDQEEDVP